MEAFKSILEKIFSWNLFWKFICSVTNVIVIMFSSYFMMVCLAHGLGRTKSLEFLLYGAVYTYIIVWFARLMKRKLGKTKVYRT